MSGRRTGEQSKRITAFWKKRRTGKRRYPHNLNTIPIFVISSRKITGEVWKTRLPVGNTKRACRGTIAMNSLTSLRWTEKRRKWYIWFIAITRGKRAGQNSGRDKDHGHAGRKIPHSRVSAGERLYFMEKGSGSITATG